MIVVSDTSPLINLARIGQLQLLHQLFNTITVPEAVWHEVVVQGAGLPGASTIKTASWVEPQPVMNQDLVQALLQDLDRGEAEAIALAIEVGADILLMDERLGRATARHFGLNTIGLIGVLVEAKHKHFIESVRPILDALRNDAGFWIRDALYDRVLADLHE